MSTPQELTYLGQYQAAVDSALVEMAETQTIARIWAHDHTVWKPEPTEISNRLGWLHIAGQMKGAIGALSDLANDVAGDGYTDALLLGMGGSSLAPEVLSTVFGGRVPGSLSLAVLDSTDPRAVLAHAERLSPERTLFIVSTKSGGTVETFSFFKFFFNWTASALGARQAGRHFVAITDPGSALADLAERHGFRATFLNDPTIGGRYSALSYFGLVPAALVGVDLARLLDRSLAMSYDCQPFDRSVATPRTTYRHPETSDPSTYERENPAAWLGCILGELAKAGRDKMTVLTSPELGTMGEWLEQLIAESTGKEGKGILPVVGGRPGGNRGEPLGRPAVYGDDRLFVQLRLDGDATYDSALQALEGAGHPVVRLPLTDVYDLGGQFFLWELATSVAGQRLGINPFDQPNVEAAKALARKAVAAYRETGTLPHEEPEPLSSDTIRAFLAQAQAGDYVAFQAFVQPTADTDTALTALRTAVRDQLKLATTVGYGPRFLHSTGQLHKGDAGNGLFVQFTADDARDVPIPDEAVTSELLAPHQPTAPEVATENGKAAGMTFGVLKTAQALGDKLALLENGRRVIRLHLGEDVSAGLTQLSRGLF